MVKVQNEEKMALLLGRNTEERGERWVISVLQRKLCMKCMVVEAEGTGLERPTA